MADHVSEERLDRALTAFLRQELQAPATAVADFLDIIIEDARTTGLNQVLSDLDRMHAASLKLNSFVCPSDGMTGELNTNNYFGSMGTTGSFYYYSAKSSPTYTEAVR